MSSRSSSSDGRYALVIYAACKNDSGADYHSIWYLDLDTSAARTRIVVSKLLTPYGLFVLDEAYGLNSNRTDGDDSGKECVICLTEDKDTLAKPCKHVSLCHSCAEVVIRGNR